MTRKRLLVVSLAAAGFLFALAGESEALPNFARKYGADCSMCHVAVPKLNRFGYEFRLAGFRIPSQIGKEELPFNLADYFAARFVEQYSYVDFRDESTPANDARTSQLEMVEFNLFPLTGSWGRNFASKGHLTVTPGNAEIEVESAYARYVRGSGDRWFQARIGIMPPLEGYGASDEPIGVSGPLFMGTAATGSPFMISEQDQSGIEIGVSLPKTGTSAALRINNGLNGNGEAAVGDESSKTPGQPGTNDKDVQLTLNQFYTSDSAVFLYFYRGVVPFPNPLAVPAPLSTTRDTYYRLAAFANFFALPGTLNFLAGAGWGYDRLSDYSVAGGDQVGHDYGFFGEVDYHVSPALGFGARYDFFDPSTNAAHDRMRAISAFGNSSLLVNNLRLYGEYQHQEDEVPGTSDSMRKTDSLTLMVMLAL